MTSLRYSLAVLCAGAVLVVYTAGYAQEKDADDGASFTIEQAIDLVLQNNLSLRAAKYDVIMSDSAEKRFDKKYAPTISAEGGYMWQKTPASGMSVFSGDKQYQWDAVASISKNFSSGTNLSAGVKEIYFDGNDPGIADFNIPKQPPLHKPALFVNLQQELLKNTFGVNDRAQAGILKNTTTMQRLAIIDQLAGLVVTTLVDYWNVSLQRSAADNARLELESNTQVRNIIAQNFAYGLAEGYDLNQFNALVAGAESKLDMARQSYKEAVRKLLRTLNMPPDTKVKGVTDLVETLPELDPDAGVKTAFIKRVDYRNALMQLDSAKKELSIQENGMLPSLTLSFGGTTLGQQESIARAYGDTVTGDYPGWNVRLKMSYPLGDSEAETNLRNAYLKIKQSELAVANLKLEVRDDVYSKYDMVKLQHGVLGKSRLMRNESEAYYQQIMVKFRQGKVKSLDIKTALDTVVAARQRELEALITYNVALLRLDLSKNEIFERYNVDVEKYIKQVKE
ncbi:MAG: TolC family protein [Spirochaetes bacterium]|nr:MAG: TolC family protein [Spirochaetota bacterium]